MLVWRWYLLSTTNNILAIRHCTLVGQLNWSFYWEYFYDHSDGLTWETQSTGPPSKLFEALCDISLGACVGGGRLACASFYINSKVQLISHLYTLRASRILCQTLRSFAFRGRRRRARLRFRDSFWVNLKALWAFLVLLQPEGRHWKQGARQQAAVAGGVAAAAVKEVLLQPAGTHSGRTCSSRGAAVLLWSFSC